MVVVARRAAHVGVLAGGQVDALEQVELGEQFERAEEGRAADAQPTLVPRS